MPTVENRLKTVRNSNEAMAEAMRQINPDVIAAYPITPSTNIMESFAKFVADGEVDTELVTVESEHSAMSACVGASAAGWPEADLVPLEIFYIVNIRFGAGNNKQIDTPERKKPSDFCGRFPLINVRCALSIVGHIRHDHGQICFLFL